MAIDYEEFQKWPKGEWQEGEFYGQRRLICAWDDMAALAAEIGNYPGSVWPVAKYPWGTADALARRIRFEPFDAEQRGSGKYTDYEMGILVVDYATKGPVYFGGQLITERLATTDHQTQLDYTDLAWDSAASGTPLRPNEAPHIPYYGLSYERTYHDLLTVPTNLLTWVGYTNSNTVACPVLGLNFPPRTLVYLGALVEATHKIGALPSYQVQYRFDYLPFDRNKFFRVKSAKPDGYKGYWDTMYVKNPDGGELRRYQETVF